MISWWGRLRNPDRFRLDVKRVVVIDGLDFIIRDFHAIGAYSQDDCDEIMVRFERWNGS